MRGRRKQDRRLAALMIAGGTLAVLAPVVWVADRTGAALSGVFGGAFTFAVLAYTAAGLLAVIEAGRALMREGSR